MWKRPPKRTRREPEEPAASVETEPRKEAPVPPAPRAGAPAVPQERVRRVPAPPHEVSRDAAAALREPLWKWPDGRPAARVEPEERPGPPQNEVPPEPPVEPPAETRPKRKLPDEGVPVAARAQPEPSPAGAAASADLGLVADEGPSSQAASRKLFRFKRHKRDLESGLEPSPESSRPADDRAARPQAVEPSGPPTSRRPSAPSAPAFPATPATPRQRRPAPVRARPVAAPPPAHEPPARQQQSDTRFVAWEEPAVPTPVPAMEPVTAAIILEGLCSRCGQPSRRGLCDTCEDAFRELKELTFGYDER